MWIFILSSFRNLTIFNRNGKQFNYFVFLNYPRVFMKYIIVIVLFLCTTFTITAQTVITLWPKGAPDAIGSADKDMPTLTMFSADSGITTKSAVVICPGGGYHHLSKHLSDLLNLMR